MQKSHVQLHHVAPVLTSYVELQVFTLHVVLKVTFQIPDLQDGTNDMS